MFRNVKYVPPNTPCPYQLVSSSVQIPFWGQHSWHTNVYVYPYIRPHKKRRGPTRKRKETYDLHQHLRCTVYPTCRLWWNTMFLDLLWVMSSSGFGRLCTPCQNPDDHDPPRSTTNGWNSCMSHSPHQRHWTFHQSPFHSKQEHTWLSFENY